MNRILGRAAAAAVVLGLAGLAGPAMADDWPSRPLTLIVPFGPGSSPDTMARIVAEHAGETLGQTIVVQNRPGASGNLGTNAIAQSKPDGYTFGVSITGPMVNNTVLYAELPYDPKKDLVPLTLAVHQFNVLAVAAESPYQNFEQLLAAMKDPANDFNFPSTGAGTISHLSVELLLERTGGKAVHVAYNSSPAAVTSLISQDTDFAALPPIAVMPMIRDGKLRPLAAVASERLSFLPEVPTVNEFGMENVEGSGWIGFVAPAGMPADIETRLADALIKALHDPDLAERLRNLYMEPVGNTPEEFGRYMDEELARWAPLIKRLKLSVN
ncbi:MAG: tripartite tricarboxylate transporter substrate binding protein [Castellaniella sp.]